MIILKHKLVYVCFHVCIMSSPSPWIFLRISDVDNLLDNNFNWLFTISRGPEPILFQLHHFEMWHLFWHIDMFWWVWIIRKILMSFRKLFYSRAFKMMLKLKSSVKANPHGKSCSFSQIWNDWTSYLGVYYQAYPFHSNINFS